MLFTYLRISRRQDQNGICTFLTLMQNLGVIIIVVVITEIVMIVAFRMKKVYFNMSAHSQCESKL